VLVIFGTVSLCTLAVWTAALLFVLPLVAGDDRCIPPHPATVWDKISMNFLPRLTSNCDPPNLCLPSS
jgi:hypothetical protein